MTFSSPVAAAFGTLAALLLSMSIAEAQTTYVPIEQHLSASELRATGISRLTSSELAELNRILREQQLARSESKDNTRFGFFGASAQSTKHSDEPRAIESAIEGDFRGWFPGAVIPLANGQAWRVTEGSLQTNRIAGPTVTIERSGMGSHFLKVEGYSARAKVTRVR